MIQLWRLQWYLKDAITKSHNKLDSKNALFVSDKINDLDNCNFYIITVPTPFDKNNRPILLPLIKASETVESVLKLAIMLFMKIPFIQVQLKKIVYQYLKSLVG